MRKPWSDCAGILKSRRTAAFAFATIMVIAGAPVAAPALDEPGRLPAPGTASWSYAIGFAGLNIASFTFAADVSAGRYAVALQGQTAGLAGLLADQRHEMHADGNIVGGRLLPEHHFRRWTKRGKVREMAITYPPVAAGSPELPTVESTPPPPARLREAALSLLQESGGVDTLTAALSVLLPANQKQGACDLDQTGFDGLGLYRIEAQPLGMETVKTGSGAGVQALHCTLAITKLGPWKDADDERQSQKLHQSGRSDYIANLWLVPRGTLLVPLYGELKLQSGATATMSLVASHPAK